MGLASMIAIAYPCAIYIHAITLQWWRLTTPDSYWFRWNIRHIVMLTLDDQRVRLFALVHIRIWMYCCLFSFDDRNCTPTQPHFNGDGSLTTPDWYCFRWNIRHIVMLTLDKQRVRLFVFVHIRIWMCCCLFSFDDCDCTPTRVLYTCMQSHSNGDGSRLWIDIDFGGIYDTLLC